MLALVRVVGRGTVNKTVVTVGPEKKRIVLGLKDTAILKHGDRIGLEGQRPALAVRVEVKESAPACLAEKRNSAEGVEEVAPDDVEASSPGRVHPVIDAAAASARGSPKDESASASTCQKNDQDPGGGVMLMLVGIPGSGKSTFCKKLEDLGKWVRVNQDSIGSGKRGTKEQCLKAARSALKSGKSCLIDRINSTSDQRGDFLDIARRHTTPSHALVLNVEPKVCVERVVHRLNHEGGVQGKGGARVVHMNKNSLARSGAPTLDEGFSSIRICNDVESVAEACEFWTKVTRSENMASSTHLKRVEGTVMGNLKQWEKPPQKKQNKSTPSRGVKRPQPESPSTALQLGPKRPRASASPERKPMEGRRNAFDVLMASARKASTTTGEQLKSQLRSPPKSPPKQLFEKSTRFPRVWQQVLHKVANRPEENRAKFPGMLVDDRCVVIKDCFPKARHHYLVIARDNQLEGIDDVRKEHSELLIHMKEVGERLTSKLTVPEGIGFKYGFHSVPSMRQLHMHVISTDFLAPGLTKKKHWNSFTTEFFLHIDDVLEVIEKEGCISVNAEEAEEILKRPLACHRCEKVQESLPKLKDHIRSCGM